eukprot:2745300-Alexandrium_andersonii.AAC.1
MSASLVGSEMCIRDRREKAARRQLVAERVTAKNNTRVDSDANGRLAPVSYTHLTLPTICSV